MLVLTLVLFSILLSVKHIHQLPITVFSQPHAWTVQIARWSSTSCFALLIASISSTPATQVRPRSIQMTNTFMELTLHNLTESDGFFCVYVTQSLTDYTSLCHVQGIHVNVGFYKYRKNGSSYNFKILAVSSQWALQLHVFVAPLHLTLIPFVGPLNHIGWAVIEPCQYL